MQMQWAIVLQYTITHYKWRFSIVVSSQGIRELIYKSNVMSILMSEIATSCVKGKSKSPKKEWSNDNEQYSCHNNDFTKKHV